LTRFRRSVDRGQYRLEKLAGLHIPPFNSTTTPTVLNSRGIFSVEDRPQIEIDAVGMNDIQRRLMTFH
jgi:hypothetical protein